MRGFADLLGAKDIEAVSAFVETEFVRCRAVNTRYHTTENGWPDHRERYGAAYPHVLGSAIPPNDDSGLRLFRETCAVCHDRPAGSVETGDGAAAPADVGRNVRRLVPTQPAHGEQDGDHEHGQEHADAHGGDHEESYGRAYAATEKTVHDRIPALTSPTPFEAAGEHLYQDNCAMCHAADGTGKNWIGGFLRPHPPDLTARSCIAELDDRVLADSIRQGIPGSSMPAFGNVFNDDQVAALIAYLRKAFFPRQRMR